ncbi:MAG TPA: MerR family transcriptional regulator [Pseudonocardiaceae bacterium]
MPKQLGRQPGSGATTGAAAVTAHGRVGDELFLGVAAVARQLGVAPATLRTWDRRYGLGPTGHAPGAHRRYGATDVARLEVMQHALLQGAAPAEAARYALASLTQPVGGAPPGAPELAPGPAPAGPEPLEPAVPSVRQVRIGGRSLRLPGAGARARGLARAAVALDAGSVRRTLDESLAADGVITTWDLVVRPVLGAIATCWEGTGAGVEIEHLLTDGALGAFRAAREAESAPGTGRSRPVLLTCVPDELHSLPLYPLSATLVARSVHCRVLGAALPADALAAAVRRTAPSVVFLWAQMAGYAAPDVLAGLPRIRPRVRVFAGGPGWSGVPLPASVELVETLATAADRIAAVASTTPRRRVNGDSR